LLGIENEEMYVHSLSCRQVSGVIIGHGNAVNSQPERLRCHFPAEKITLTKLTTDADQSFSDADHSFSVADHSITDADLCSQLVGERCRFELLLARRFLC
jgi:hypothetical protein